MRELRFANEASRERDRREPFRRLLALSKLPVYGPLRVPIRMLRAARQADRLLKSDPERYVIDGVERPRSNVSGGASLGHATARRRKCPHFPGNGAILEKTS